MKITEYKSLDKGALKGSFNIVIPQWGLTIRNCRDFESNGRSWIGYPSHPYDDPETGKKKYFSFIYWDEKVKDRFESAVREELKKHRGTPTHEDISKETEDIPF